MIREKVSLRSKESSYEQRDTTEVSKCQIAVEALIPTVGNSPEIFQPGEQSLDFPSSLIATQFTPVLRNIDAIGFVRSNQLNAFLVECSSERITVVSAICNESFRYIGKQILFESFMYKGDFSWRSTSCVEGDWNTMSVCHCHDLGALTTACFTDFGTPFFAPMNVASTKHSLKSILPAS